MRQIAAATLVLAALAVPAAAADDAINRQPKAIVRQVGKDALDLATAPVRWKRHEWTRFAEGSAIVVAAYAADEQIVRIVSRQHNRLLDNYLRDVTHLGGGYGLDVAALMGVGGLLGHDDRMFAAGLDAVESSFAAAGFVTPAIKDVVGRARPIHELGKHSFHPFNSTYQSFPSGHATNAFALATAIATRYDDSRFVPALAYTLATSVAIARVHDRVHFASDVLAGGMIGHAVAKSIVLNHQRARVTWIPSRNGFTIDARF